MFILTYKTIIELDFNSIETHKHEFFDLEKAFEHWRKLEWEIGDTLAYDIQLNEHCKLEKVVLRGNPSISSNTIRTE